MISLGAYTSNYLLEIIDKVLSVQGKDKKNLNYNDIKQ
jgi:hypothetical protein